MPTNAPLRNDPPAAVGDWLLKMTFPFMSTRLVELPWDMPNRSPFAKPISKPVATTNADPNVGIDASSKVM